MLPIQSKMSVAVAFAVSVAGAGMGSEASRTISAEPPAGAARCFADEEQPGIATLEKLASIKVPGKAHDVCLADNRAFVSTDEGLAIIDISNPTLPNPLGQLPVPGSNLGVQVQGGYAFLANRSQGLVVLDLSNTAAPTVVASIPVSKCWSVALKDKVAYALSLTGSLHVVDVSNPAEPRELFRFGLPAWRPADYNHKPASPAQEADYLAALQSHSGKGNNYKTGLFVKGNRLAAVDWVYGRIYLYEVSNPGKPAFKGTHFAPYLLQVVMSDDWLFGFAAYNRLSGVYSVPIADLAPDKPTGYHRGAARGFIAAGTSVDMGGIGISESGRHVCWYGGKTGQVQVIDITDPVHMKLVASAWLPNHDVKMPEILGVKCQGDLIYIAAGAQGLAIYRFPGL